MVLTRYESGKNVTAAAQASGRTIQGAYKALKSYSQNIIRLRLFRACHRESMSKLTDQEFLELHDMLDALVENNLPKINS